MRTNVWLVWALLAFAEHSSGAPVLSFNKRLSGIAVAIDEHGRRFQSNPVGHAKVAWLHVDSDNVPDAVVFLKKGPSDCALQFDARTEPCLGLVFLGEPQGGYTLVLRFPYRGQKLYLSELQQQGRTLYISDTVQADDQPTYYKYTMAKRKFTASNEAYRPSQILSKAFVVLSDRLTDPLEKLKYAAENFPNEGSALSPFRVHVDAVNARYPYYVKPDRLRRFAKDVFPIVTRDVSEWTKRFGWNTPLNVRMWVCTDWVVLRRFWELEDEDIGDVGGCIDPLAYLPANDLPLGALAVDAFRLRLMQDICMALLLRGDALPVDTVEKLKKNISGQEARRLVFAGSVMATALSIDTRTFSLQHLLKVQKSWTSLPDWWFKVFEEDNGRIAWSAELKGFADDLQERLVAVECALQALEQNVLKTPDNSPPCPADKIEIAQNFISLIRRLYVP